ncbi:MAG: hypothetical protein RLZZ22_279 [Pseudomonadota bacterium]|jgi:hypothetical protein
MHSAPSVEYPAGRSTFQDRLERLLPLAWLALQLAWWVSLRGGALPGAWWCSGLFGLGLWGVARWRSRQPVVGRLCWEPAPAPAGAGALPAPGPPGRWIWRSQAYRHGTELADLRWALDLQGQVLLRLRNAAGLGWWVWLERDSAPADWQALRVALVAWREARRPSARRSA